MPLPIMTDKTDIDALIAYLKKKPTGATIDEAKATLQSRLVDGRKMNAYRSWGFITDNGDKLLLTSRGREYAQASEEEKKKIFLAIIKETKVYEMTLEWIYNRNFDQVPATDVASHWYTHFRTDIGTETEQSLTNQVTCFMSIADAAGLGEYLIGRKGQSTRLVINKAALQSFIEASIPDTTTESDSGKQTASSDEDAVSPVTVPADLLHKNVPIGYGSNPSLHIDIQIHIDSDATLDQIDKIFESMAKHLYKNGTS